LLTKLTGDRNKYEIKQKMMHTRSMVSLYEIYPYGDRNLLI